MCTFKTTAVSRPKALFLKKTSNLYSARLLNRRTDNLPLGKENSAKMHRKGLTILKCIKCWNLRNCGYLYNTTPFDSETTAELNSSNQPGVLEPFP